MTVRPTLTLIPHGRLDLERVVLEASHEILIGRSSRCHVRLPKDARFVSRHHATFAYVDGGWYLTDVSRRGTFLGSERLPAGQTTAIQHGDRLRFGECEYVASTGEVGIDLDAFGPDGTYTMSMQAVDLAAVDAFRVLKSALELPERLGTASSEGAVYGAACEYLVSTLSPAIATAYATVAGDDGTIEVLASAERPDVAAARHDIVRPVVSRRVLQRLRENPNAVLFLQRRFADGTLSATATSSTHALGASLLETDPLGRAIILYAVGDHRLAEGDQLVAAYLRLVATLVRQHLLTLRRAHLAKYFSPKIVKLLEQKDGCMLLEGEPRVTSVTSLFFDVRGSSLPLDASAEDLSSVYQDLRRIIGIVTETVFECDGTVIDYAGDGVFAAWGVPLPQQDQATLAVNCAIEIARRLSVARLQSLNATRSLFGIGLAKGDVLAGAVGSTVVFKYGILGPTVSAAHRLMMLTKPDRLNRPILMTAAVHAELADKKLQTRPVGRVELPGMTAEVEVFEAVADREREEDDDDD